jgi:hypothetical protein
MANKSNGRQQPDRTPDDLWINHNSTFKAIARENSPHGATSSRFLELADIALGLKRKELESQRTAPDEVHATEKTEPYSKTD